MAKTPVSQEEIQLRKRARRRLVGAIALVLMAIVVLPMVLDGEPRQRPENIDVQIPPIPAQLPPGATRPPAPALPEAHRRSAAPARSEAAGGSEPAAAAALPRPRRHRRPPRRRRGREKAVPGGRPRAW